MKKTTKATTKTAEYQRARFNLGAEKVHAEKWFWCGKDFLSDQQQKAGPSMKAL